MINEINSLDSINAFNSPEYASTFTPIKQTISETPTTTPSASRALMRRMLTETTTPYYSTDLSTTSYMGLSTFDRNCNQLVEQFEQLHKAIQEGRYDAAFPIFQEIDLLWNGSLMDKVINMLQSEMFINSPHLRPAVELITNGALSQIKAYLLALSDNSQAIGECNEGFEKLRLGLEELKAIAREMDVESKLDATEIDQYLEMGQLMMRGLIAMSQNMRETGIDDLRAGFRKAIELNADSCTDLTDFDFDIQFPFFAKALEQKFHTSLLPASTTVDEQNPKSLFLAGRYEESLALLSTAHFEKEEDVAALRAACLALMGRHDEALSLLDPQEYWYQVDRVTLTSLVYFLKGDYEKAKEIALDSEQGNPPIGYALLLAMKGSQNS